MLKKRVAHDSLLSGLAEMSARGLAPQQVLGELPGLMRDWPAVAESVVWLLHYDPLRLEALQSKRPPLALSAPQLEALAAIREPVPLHGDDLSAAYLRASEPFRAWASEFDGLLPLHGPNGFVGLLLLRSRRGAFSARAPHVRAVRQALALLLPALELEFLREQVDRRYYRLFQLERLLLLGQMTATVVHDLRTPLATMLLQLHRLENEASELVRSTTAALRDRVADVERMIHELLDFSRAHELACATADLQQLVGRTLALVPRGRIPAGAAMHNEVAAGLSAFVDPHRLQRVLLNLLFNALDAAGPGGRVRVMAAAPSGPGQPLQLLVHDNGPGVPDEVRANLFKPFVTSKADGTGLGLYICRGLMASMGGDIQLESGSGGTTVRLSLPARAP